MVSSLGFVDLRSHTHALEGVLYLYVKTIERAHTPNKMWERIKLSKNYAQALEQVRNPSELLHLG
jgi:hypothetical protein